MYFWKFKLIYLHPPKTGGNSIQSAVIHLSDDRMTLGAFRDGKDTFEIVGPMTPVKHATLSDYAQRLTHLRQHQVAISVRHPFERAVSQYFSPSRWMRQRDGACYAETPIWNRDEFVAMLAQTPSQVSFVALAGDIRRPDFVIRHETMRHDFAVLARALDLPTELPHLNRSLAPNSPKTSILSDASLKQMVCDHFAQNTAFFGY